MKIATVLRSVDGAVAVPSPPPDPSETGDGHGRAAVADERPIGTPELGPDPSALPGWQPRYIDITVPHSARVYDYWLGGKDNFPVDRELAEEIIKVYPSIVTAAQENRSFLRRAVTFLAAEAGVRQFLDIGTGLPTADNTHEVAQAIAPSSRIVYVDRDPLVLVHARALLSSAPDGATAYVEQDLAEPEQILKAAADTLDFSAPVAVMILMTTQFIVDTEEAQTAARRLMAALPAGSYLAVSAPTGDHVPTAVGEALMASYAERGEPFQLRNQAEFAGFFTDLELVPPGIVPLTLWRAEEEPHPRPTPQEVSAYAAIGQKSLAHADLG